MNPKTTLGLAVALIIVVGGLYLTRSDEASNTTPPPPPTELMPDKSLIAKDFGEVVKVVCRRADGAEWTFERPADRTDDAGRSRWDLTAPYTAQASGWQVDGIVRKLLTYIFLTLFL